MNKYELALLIKPLSPEDITNRVVVEITNEVKSLGGTMQLKLEWDKRHLAYEIKGQSEGFYKFYTLEMTPEAVLTLDSSLKLNKDILRFLIISEDNL